MCSVAKFPYPNKTPLQFIINQPAGWGPLRRRSTLELGGPAFWLWHKTTIKANALQEAVFVQRVISSVDCCVARGGSHALVHPVSVSSTVRHSSSVLRRELSVPPPCLRPLPIATIDTVPTSYTITSLVEGKSSFTGGVVFSS